MAVGARVVRGPDWNLGNEDGGDGHLGTVVSVKNEIAHVIWDTGKESTCRAGKSGKHDLYILDNAAAGVQFKIQCSECQKKDFHGMKYTSSQSTNTSLCSRCYHEGKHNQGQIFQLFDSPHSEGLRLPKRSSSDRTQAMGMFQGAKVVRGKHWEWKDQDGGAGKSGEVMEVTSWGEDDSDRDAIRICWDTGVINSYRVGFRGKVDLKCIEAAPGFEYYPDHLPILGKEAIEAASSGKFKVGDRVYVEKPAMALTRSAENGGAWNLKIEQVLGKIGTVKSAASGNNISVEIDGNVVILKQDSLHKIPVLKIGDMVRIMEDKERVKKFQEKHGDWVESMAQALGKVGKVMKFTEKGDVIIGFGQQFWMFNPACCVPVTDSPATTLNATQDRQDVETGEALTILFFSLVIIEHSDSVGEEFMKAIGEKDKAKVNKMLDEQPDLANKEINGTTALILASYRGDEDIVKLLLKKGAKVDMTVCGKHTPLLAAVAGEKKKVIEILIEKGANINFSNPNGRTPCHAAARIGMEDILKLLIAKGCNVNVRDKEGDTPLIDAVSNNKPGTTAILLANKKVDVRIQNNKGTNVLHIAAATDNVGVIEKVLQRCPEMANDRRVDECSPLHVAAIYTKLEAIKVLVKKGKANMNVSDSNGMTPLHVAAVEANGKSLELLCELGADTCLTDHKGNTPLHMVLGVRDVGVDLLFALTGMPDIQSEVRFLLAQTLVKHGAAPDQVNKVGKTPLDLLKNDQQKSILLQLASKSKGKRKSAGQGESRACSIL